MVPELPLGESTKAVPGEVSVQDRSCRVLSNTAEPAVWDLEHSIEVRPWLLTLRDRETRGGLAFEYEGLFPTEQDFFFEMVTAEQAMCTLLPQVLPLSLPAGTDFITQDPYAEFDSPTAVGTRAKTYRRGWSRSTIAIVACSIAAGIVILTLAAWNRRNYFFCNNTQPLSPVWPFVTALATHSPRHPAHCLGRILAATVWASHAVRGGRG